MRVWRGIEYGSCALSLCAASLAGAASCAPAGGAASATSAPEKRAATERERTRVMRAMLGGSRSLAGEAERTCAVGHAARPGMVQTVPLETHEARLPLHREGTLRANSRGGAGRGAASV